MKSIERIIIALMLFSVYFASSQNMNLKTMKKDKVKLIIDYCEIIDRGVKKKHYFTITLISKQVGKKYNFIFEMDSEKFEYELENDLTQTIYYDETFKIIDAKAKYKIIDKNNILKNNITN